jgi:hypothetical protein
VFFKFLLISDDAVDVVEVVLVVVVGVVEAVLVVVVGVAEVVLVVVDVAVEDVLVVLVEVPLVDVEDAVVADAGS